MKNQGSESLAFYLAPRKYEDLRNLSMREILRGVRRTKTEMILMQTKWILGKMGSTARECDGELNREVDDGVNSEVKERSVVVFNLKIDASVATNGDDDNVTTDEEIPKNSRETVDLLNDDSDTTDDTNHDIVLPRGNVRAKPKVSESERVINGTDLCKALNELRKKKGSFFMKCFKWMIQSLLQLFVMLDCYVRNWDA